VNIKRIFPDQQFPEVGHAPVQSGPRAPAMDPDAGGGLPSFGQSEGGSDMPANQAWDPQADIQAPDDAHARLFVPMDRKVPSSVPPRLPKIEPPADLIFSHNELIGDLHSSLAYPAHAVIVDNYSNQWLWFPSARRHVPPYTFGAVLPLFQGTELAEYLVQAPASFTQAALHANQYVVTIWTAAMQFASSGSAIVGGIA
jgi:hypothetical protein